MHQGDRREPPIRGCPHCGNRRSEYRSKGQYVFRTHPWDLQGLDQAEATGPGRLRIPSTKVPSMRELCPVGLFLANP